MTSADVTARSAGEVLTWSRRTIEPALRAAVDTLPPSMARVAAYHFGWRDEHDRPVQTPGGKAIRPAFALLAAAAVGDDTDLAIPPAVAIELVHNFSLLHDDVMDGDTTRRHRPAAWKVFGTGEAILAGDAMLILATQVLAGSSHPAAREQLEELNSAVLTLIDGQNMDLAFERRAGVGLRECLAMATGKTGALLGSACALGALAGGATAGQIERLREFGEHLGLAFQAIDDLLGIVGDPIVTGKPVHSDLRARKKTLPVVAALTSRSPDADELNALYHGRQPLSGHDLTRATELIESTGGLDWARDRADEQLAEALRQLESTQATARAATELDSLVRLVTRRDVQGKEHNR